MTCASLEGMQSICQYLMLTARGQSRDREMAENAGVSRFMTKPFSNAESADSSARPARAGNPVMNSGEDRTTHRVSDLRYFSSVRGYRRRRLIGCGTPITHSGGRFGWLFRCSGRMVRMRRLKAAYRCLRQSCISLHAGPWPDPVISLIFGFAARRMAGPSDNSEAETDRWPH